MLIVLDTGPLSLLSNPARSGPAKDAQEWAETRLLDGDHFVVPEISDYELRRELIRAGKSESIESLDRLCVDLGYEPITTDIMRKAADMWANARNAGLPTAADPALDGDVILAAQARSLRGDDDNSHDDDDSNDDVVVATTNVTHLERYVTARLWETI